MPERVLQRKEGSVKLGFAGKEEVTEEGGHRHRAKKQLNNVKLSFAGEENLTEEGGHRQGAKKQVNSVKLGLPYRGNRTERTGQLKPSYFNRRQSTFSLEQLNLLHVEQEAYNACACADSLTRGRTLRMRITFKSSERGVCKEVKRKYRIRKILRLY